MTVFLNAQNKVVVQGITGNEGMKHTRRMLTAGTKIVAGVNPGKAGTQVTLNGETNPPMRVPVYGNVRQAREATGADTSVIFVPPRCAKTAVLDAVEAGIELIVVVTGGIPAADTVEYVDAALTAGARVIGPNSPGIISPGKSNVGIIPVDITGPGPIGLVSKSGTLTYQMMSELSDVGFTTCIGIGGDPIVGTTHIDALAAFQDDPDTEIIILVGEIGGDAEERAAEFIRTNVTKPVIGYVAGFAAPEGKTMGHAGAIVTGSVGTAEAKKEALEAVGVSVGRTPSHTAQLVREVLQ